MLHNVTEGVLVPISPGRRMDSDFRPPAAADFAEFQIAVGNSIERSLRSGVDVNQSSATAALGGHSAICVFASHAGAEPCSSEACICGLLSDLRLGMHCITRFRSSQCFDRTDGPAQRGNQQPAQDEGELTHVTRTEYNTSVHWSTEIRHFGTNTFWYDLAVAGPCGY